MKLKVEQTRDIALCLALRHLVFIHEQGVSEVDEIDDLDEVSVHLVAWDGSKAVGTARLTIEREEAKIGRVCVLKARRGHGTGALLIREALDVARAHKAKHGKLGAQIHALAFYRSLGFEVVGDVYDDAGIPHRDMVCQL